MSTIQTDTPLTYAEAMRRDRDDEHVYVMTVDHKHGSDSSAHRTHEGAVAAVYGYVALYWDDMINAGVSEADRKPLPEDMDEAIDAYFEFESEFQMNEESYRIERLPLLD